MGDEIKIIYQCVELANQVINSGLSASIHIKMGKEFTFEFDNQRSMNITSNKNGRSPEQSKLKHKRAKKEKSIDSTTHDVFQAKTEEVAINTRANHVDLEKKEDEFEDFCEKLFLVPKYRINRSNRVIEKEITRKLSEHGIRVRSVYSNRSGHPFNGEYIRSVVLIEPFQRLFIRDGRTAIDNYWVHCEK